MLPALASCTSTPTPTPAASDVPLPPSAPEIDVVLTEYRFEVPAALPTGRVVFRFRNEGQEPHRPSLLRLPDDFPPVQQEVRNTEARQVLPYAGIPTRPPGTEGTFAVDLVRGQRYALVCFMTAPDGEGHANKGMTWEGRAGGGPVTPVKTTVPASGSLGG